MRLGDWQAIRGTTVISAIGGINLGITVFSITLLARVLPSAVESASDGAAGEKLHMQCI